MSAIKCGVVAVFASLCLAVQAGNCTWTNFTANTPATAYSWNNPGNWENGAVGGEGDSVTITPSAKVYIRVPDGGVTVHKMRGNKDNTNAILIGGPITLKSSGTLAEWTTAAQTFCDIVVPEGETIKPEIDNLDLRGHIVNYSSVYAILRNGNNYFHCDYFAETAGETRMTDLVQEGNLGIAGGVTTLYGPEGAAAASGTWTLTAGSPYATRVSSAAHKLAVGTIVTAAGNLPSGTFLKRVFDNATIELSEPAAASGDVTLSFSAFTANFTARVPNRTYQHGSYGYFLIRKYRTQDVCRMVLEDYRGNQSALATLYGGFSYDTQYNNGTLVFRKVTVGDKPMKMDVYALNMEFAGAGDTGVTTLPEDFSLVMTKKLTAHMLVANNMTGVVSVMTNFHGTVAKDGAGLLKIGLGDAANEGSLVVNAGTLQIVRNATVASGAALSVDSLAIKGGATFTLPDGGMTVKTLSIEAGATLAGEGELVVEDGASLPGDALAGLSRPGGATVRLMSLGEADALQLAEPSHDAPAGHPAFWLDASRPDTVVTNADGGVMRWNDCRAGETMFCTNIASACPTYVCGEKMKAKYVKISRVDSASTIEDTQTLVWSVPIDGIKAVFLMQDPTDFGGEILGRTVARCPNSCYKSNGGPYYRSTASLSWSQPLVSNSADTPDCVRYGRFFLNGVEVNGATTGYLGAFLQLVEHHVNTGYDASSSRHDLICDAFGTGCGADLKWKGGMRIAEYVIYTNSLTHAERVQTAQYLCRKWLGRNVYWSVSDGASDIESSATTANGDALDVADGKEASAGTVSAGTLVKDGGGTLYVDSLGSDALTVRAGEVLVGAHGREHDVPRDAWLHVDATESDTIVKTNAKNNAVHSWADVNGIGRTLRSIRQQRDPPSATGWPLYTSTSTINGLACVDLGARQTSNSGGFVVFEADGKISEGQDATYSSMTAPELKTFFVVYDSTAGGGTILGGVGSDFPKKGMPRMWYSDADRPNGYPICYHVGNSTVEGQVAVISNACESGTAKFVRNGVVTNPCTAFFLGGPERMALRLSTGRKCAVFGAYGGSGIRGDYFGGLKYGEIICFERFLSDAEVARVDAYLAKKWFDIDTPGYSAPSAGALKVASGAKVTLLGDDALSATSVTGGGTLDGDLALSGGGIDLEIGEGGTLPCFTVTGAADLSNGGTVTVAGKFRDLQPGVYTIFSAASLSFGGEWSVSAATTARTFELAKVGDSLVLKVFKSGVMLLVR